MWLREQPVLLLSLMVCRLKPPTNEPQGILAALSRSPMFLLVIWTCDVLLEQVSPAGSVSLISVRPPCPSAIVLVEPTTLTAPLVVPENMLIAPGVDGPKSSVQALSLIAKFWA